MRFATCGPLCFYQALFYCQNKRSKAHLSLRTSCITDHPEKLIAAQLVTKHISFVCTRLKIISSYVLKDYISFPKARASYHRQHWEMSGVEQNVTRGEFAFQSGHYRQKQQPDERESKMSLQQLVDKNKYFIIKFTHFNISLSCAILSVWCR